MSDEEFRVMMKQFMEQKIPCGVLTIIPEFSHHFIPQKILTPLPKPMSFLFQKKLRGSSLQVLLKEAEEKIHLFQFTLEQSNALEAVTRRQRKSQLWNAYR